jgi:aspartyl-tRNA(Asn)/glutamyl-tRNA(Gln) amidotransferase subunit A
VSVTFDKIAELTGDFHFCEAPGVSLPVDEVQQKRAGPLAGKVIGLKSNIRVSGQAWTAGVGARADHIAQTDAPLVALLRGAGALILSRLAMDEGALGATTDNPHFGRCENPASPGHSAGGSSGGSAAAVAAGAVDAALGSDTMGSVRIPAAYCGVYGLKAGSGALDMEGVFPLAPSLDALGLFANTPALLRSVFDVLRDASDEGAPIQGWIAPESGDLPPCHRDVTAFFVAVQAALGKLLGPGEAGNTVDFAGLRNDAFLLTEVEAVTSLGSEAGLSAGLSRLIDFGRKVSPEKLGAAQARMAVARTDLRRRLAGTHALLLPAVAQPAFAQGTPAPKDQADFTVLANVADLPAIAIPKLGAQPPVSVQLVGPQGAERALIDLAERLSETL